MAKSDPLGIRLEPGERAALERAARADDRSMCALGRKIIAEWLREEGCLGGEEEEQAASPAG